MNYLIFLTVVLALTWRSCLGCIGDGCVHDRQRDQFFWCSGNIGSERQPIRDWFGGLHRAGYEAYCTGVSAMIVTTDPQLRSHAARLCGDSTGQGHQVICHEDISYREL